MRHLNATFLHQDLLIHSTNSYLNNYKLIQYWIHPSVSILPIATCNCSAKINSRVVPTELSYEFKASISTDSILTMLLQIYYI